MDASSTLNNAIQQPEVLAPMSVPLVGRALIEASAGTGKTYTLSLLYLRLLLGIGENGYSRPLSIDEILVVTFTQAATEELRYRIRENIHQLRIACLRGKHDDPIYQHLLTLIDDRQYAIQTLLYAEQQMDEAAIYTIHSFCQRVLTTNAFESGVLFEQELVQDETPLKLQVVEDFWRRYFYPLSESLAYVVQQIWRNPVMLLADLIPYLADERYHCEKQSDVSITERITQFHQQKVAHIDQVKFQWQQHGEHVAALLNNSGVSKQSYGRFVPNWLVEIKEWAYAITQDYQLPKNLARFSQSVLIEKTKKGEPPVHALFSITEQLCTTSFDLRNELLFEIAAIVKQALQQEKRRRAEMGFDDLLGQLNTALHYTHGSALASMVAKRYPVAMIDEFQDTDPTQYQIFDRIYQDRQTTGLVLIGDPKQAIYGFRGADIFTYIQAKQHVDRYFSMETNWRSSWSMVDAVNQLFNAHDKPFVFDAIPFVKVKAAPKNKQKQFQLHGQNVAAAQVCILPESITSVSAYQQMIAEYSAEQILGWLTAGQQQQAWLVDNEDKRRLVTAADIAILVRTGTEAEIMQKALAKRAIRSVYLSNRKSVFDSQEAREMLWLLQAVLMPENERYLRTALATQLLSSSMAEIDHYNHNQDGWESVAEEFQDYQHYWANFGVLVMLRRIMTYRHIAENCLAKLDGERILTNFMHLGELLQEASTELDSEPALLRWLSLQIEQHDPNLDNQQQRLESDDNLVKIITIHKSKGLEYPLVWLPFICHYRTSDKKIYHDRHTYQVNIAAEGDEEAQGLIEEERLAEDLRLLYVALTRSIYHCSIGMAGLKTRKSAETNLHQSALGYLIQQGQAGDYAYLKHCLSNLNGLECVEVNADIITQDTSHRLITRNTQQPILTANSFQRKLDYSWRVTSYSGLQQHGAATSSEQLFNELFPKFDFEAQLVSPLEEWNETNDADDKEMMTELVDDIHHFPKGAAVGTALHTLMESIDFTQPQAEQPLLAIIEKLNLSPHWLPILSDWLMGVLATPLALSSAADNFCLNQIATDKRLIELQFYLPIRQSVTAAKLDKLCKKYDGLSQQCPPLSFSDIKGMLKGFIDLVFEWQGRFYVLDYKSNWLGDTTQAYSPQALEMAMCEHRYDLQYQLYSLALHRYLKCRLPNYQYETHFGGVYYLFLRGMDPTLEGNGVFFTRPDTGFITALDRLFG